MSSKVGGIARAPVWGANPFLTNNNNNNNNNNNLKLGCSAINKCGREKDIWIRVKSNSPSL